MPGMYQAPSGQLGRIKNPQPYFSSNIGMLAGVGPMGFNPANLFANGEQGGWYDPSDFSTLFQDSAGTTPVTAVGQPVGLVLDKHVPKVQHTTKVDTLSPAYTGSSFSCVGNTITCAAAAINDQVSFAGGSVFSTAEYSRCEVVFTVTGSGTYNVYAGNSPIACTATGTPTTYVASTVNASNGILLFRATTAGAAATFTVLSITGYPGNHLTQATTTKRPILQQDAGGHVYLNFDGVDDGLALSADWTINQPSTGVLCFSVPTIPGTNAYLYGGNTGREDLFLDSFGQINTYASVQLMGPIITINTPYVIQSNYNGLSSGQRLNKATITSGNAGTNTSVGFGLGGLFDATGFYISEKVYGVIFISRSLTSAEKNSVDTYMGNKIGIVL